MIKQGQFAALGGRTARKAFLPKREYAQIQVAQLKKLTDQLKALKQAQPKSPKIKHLQKKIRSLKKRKELNGHLQKLGHPPLEKTTNPKLAQKRASSILTTQQQPPTKRPTTITRTHSSGPPQTPPLPTINSSKQQIVPQTTSSSLQQTTITPTQLQTQITKGTTVQEPYFQQEIASQITTLDQQITSATSSTLAAAIAQKQNWARKQLVQIEAQYTHLTTQAKSGALKTPQQKAQLSQVAKQRQALQVATTNPEKPTQTTQITFQGADEQTTRTINDVLRSIELEYNPTFYATNKPVVFNVNQTQADFITSVFKPLSEGHSARVIPLPPGTGKTKMAAPAILEIRVRTGANATYVSKASQLGEIETEMIPVLKNQFGRQVVVIKDANNLEQTLNALQTSRANQGGIAVVTTDALGFILAHADSRLPIDDLTPQMKITKLQDFFGINKKQLEDYLTPQARGTQKIDTEAQQHVSYKLEQELSKPNSYKTFSDLPDQLQKDIAKHIAELKQNNKNANAILDALADDLTLYDEAHETLLEFTQRQYYIGSGNKHLVQARQKMGAQFHDLIQEQGIVKRKGDIVEINTTKFAKPSNAHQKFDTFTEETTRQHQDGLTVKQIQQMPQYQHLQTKQIQSIIAGESVEGVTPQTAQQIKALNIKQQAAYDQISRANLDNSNAPDFNTRLESLAKETGLTKDEVIKIRMQQDQISSLSQYLGMHASDDWFKGADKDGIVTIRLAHNGDASDVKPSRPSDVVAQEVVGALLFGKPLQLDKTTSSASGGTRATGAGVLNRFTGPKEGMTATIGHGENTGKHLLGIEMPDSEVLAAKKQELFKQHFSTKQGNIVQTHGGLTEMVDTAAQQEIGNVAIVITRSNTSPEEVRTLLASKQNLQNHNMIIRNESGTWDMYEKIDGTWQTTRKDMSITAAQEQYNVAQKNTVVGYNFGGSVGTDFNFSGKKGAKPPQFWQFSSADPQKNTGTSRLIQGYGRGDRGGISHQQTLFLADVPQGQKLTDQQITEVFESKEKFLSQQSEGATAQTMVDTASSHLFKSIMYDKTTGPTHKKALASDLNHRLQNWQEGTLSTAGAYTETQYLTQLQQTLEHNKLFYQTLQEIGEGKSYHQFYKSLTPDQQAKLDLLGDTALDPKQGVMKQLWDQMTPADRQVVRQNAGIKPQTLQYAPTVQAPQTKLLQTTDLQHYIDTFNQTVTATNVLPTVSNKTPLQLSKELDTASTKQAAQSTSATVKHPQANLPALHTQSQLQTKKHVPLTGPDPDEYAGMFDEFSNPQPIAPKPLY